MPSAFPLERLAPELQILILCKCDIPSIRHLVNLSSSIRAAFLRYPHSFIRDIVSQLPSPVEDLLCLQWVINTIPDHYLNARWITEWLQLENPADDLEFLMLNPWNAARFRPLGVLCLLADIMEEIDSAVKFYTESTLAILDLVSEPNARHSTIELSSTEYARIASAFLLLNIYDHYRRVGGDYQLFKNTLQPWQMEQIMTVNGFLEGIQHSSGSMLYYLVDSKYMSRTAACETSKYATKFFRSVCKPMVDPISYWDALSPYRHGYFWPEPHHPFEVAKPDESLGAKSLSNLEPSVFSVNYGWNLLQEIIQNDAISIRLYNLMFKDLGMLFWDEDRFLYMRLTSVEEFYTLVERLKELLYRAQVKIYDDAYVDAMPSGALARALKHGRGLRQRDIVEWTRSKVQCTFGEWMVRS